MYFERIYDEGLAEASYIIACQATNQAIVVDPVRDLDIYFDRLDELGYDITGVAETHIHADFLSGGRDLARATGATLYISGEQEEGWEYDGLEGIEYVELNDEDDIELGGVVIRALHTPGHTPEHLSYLVTDTAQADEPMMLLSGDFAFVGDLGRPDLLEKAAGEMGTAKKGARQLFDSVRDKLLELPDTVQIWPNHGAGSACGKALGAIPTSTVGYERKNAWWAPYFEGEGDVDGFIDELLAGQPESPKYFRNMKQMNRDGVDGGDTLPTLSELTPRGFKRALEENDAVLLDARSKEDFAEGHVPGAINLPSVKAVSTHAGWVVPYDRPLVIYAQKEDLDEVRRRLYRIGFTDFAGYIPRLEGYADQLEAYEVLEASQVRSELESDEAVAVDVRSQNEFDEEHVAGAIHAHYGTIDEAGDELPRDKELLVYCGSGARANVAISVLKKAGFKRLKNAGGFDALAEAGVPVEG
ncbi:MAG: MBL fold metallo-hydrolase [Persicimonas sp.]